jgi:hypothetical protein
VEFADAGRRLISAGDDGVILIWSTGLAAVN